MGPVSKGKVFIRKIHCLKIYVQIGHQNHKEKTGKSDIKIENFCCCEDHHRESEKITYSMGDNFWKSHSW